MRRRERRSLLAHSGGRDTQELEHVTCESDSKLDKRARATCEGQSSDRIDKINGLTKAIALLVKGMTRKRFLQNGEIVGSLKRLKNETSADLTALEKKVLDRKPKLRRSAF